MGNHLLLEVYDIEHNLLNDGISLQGVMERGIERAGMTILNIFQHCHVSCHTWPERGCIAIDVYTCGEGNPKLVALELLKYFNSDNYKLRQLDR
jgi:S-adenosylmethionine/arginine decarboxylase-like enzyme